MFTRRYLPVLTLCLFGIVRPINAELANGPMLADVAMREASVWIQAKEPSVVRVRYSTETEEYWTLPIETDNHLGHTATLTLGEVEPAQRYSYQIELNGTLLGPVYNFESPVFFS